MKARLQCAVHGELDIMAVYFICVALRYKYYLYRDATQMKDTAKVSNSRVLNTEAFSVYMPYCIIRFHCAGPALCIGCTCS